jgi:hypothetical protein
LPPERYIHVVIAALAGAGETPMLSLRASDAHTAAVTMRLADGARLEIVDERNEV